MAHPPWHPAKTWHNYIYIPCKYGAKTYSYSTTYGIHVNEKRLYIPLEKGMTQRRYPDPTILRQTRNNKKIARSDGKSFEQGRSHRYVGHGDGLIRHLRSYHNQRTRYIKNKVSQ